MAFDWREDLDLDSPECNLAIMVEEFTYNWSDSYGDRPFTAKELFDYHTEPGLYELWSDIFRKDGLKLNLSSVKKGLNIPLRSGDLYKKGDVYTSYETGFWNNLDEQKLKDIVIDVEIEPGKVDPEDIDRSKLLDSLSEKGMKLKGIVQTPVIREDYKPPVSLEFTEKYESDESYNN